MTWILRAASAPTHTCPAPRSGGPFDSPSGQRGDLWRCDDCRQLWRIASACNYCDRYGDRPHPGMHAVFNNWRPATRWQRLRHRRDR